jgi:hypothetical protein
MADLQMDQDFINSLGGGQSQPGAAPAAPLVSKFSSLQVRDRGRFILSLTAEDRQLLIAALAQVNPKEAQKVEATR